MTQPDYHRLLKRQLGIAGAETGAVDLGKLLGLVSAAYDETDNDRRRSERSIRLMVEELDEVNSELERLVAARTTELEKTGQWLEATIENVEQGIVMTNAEGRIVIFNRKFLEFTGLAAEECSGNPHFSMLVDLMMARGEFDPMGESFKDWVRAQGRFSGSFSFQRTRPDGTVLHVTTQRLPDGGEVRTMSDITKIVRKSDELASTKRTLELTLENVTQGIMKFDSQRRIVVFNRRAEELLGLPDGFLQQGQDFADGRNLLVSYQDIGII